MPRQAMLGNKVRRLRNDSGLTQVALAARLGISPSYLNLIEHNQRALNRPLLLKLAEQFDLDLQVFSGSEEARLLADLTEVFGDPLFRDLGFGNGELNELVGSAPSACRGILALYRAYRNLGEDVRGLSERLAEDPFLAESSHQMLTLLTSVRSFAEILRDNADLAEPRRQHFVAVLVEESEKLTKLVKELFAFITSEGFRGLGRAESPAEEIDDALHAQRNHFPELEAAAERTREALGLGDGDGFDALRRALEKSHGVTLEMPPLDAAPGAAETFDSDRRTLVLPGFLPAGSLAFRAARHIGALSHEELFAAHVARAPLSSEAARDLYRRVLANYFAGALLMPYESFLDAARSLRHDVDLIGRRFGMGFEQVCHRLTTLHRPGAEGVPFHFLRIDIAGNVSKRFSASGLRIPRFGGLCPRWNVHAAFATPGRIDRQVARLADGTTFFCIARTVEKPAGGFREPGRRFAVGLGCEVAFARQLVYADGLDLDRPEAAVPVGVHCRICEREDCAQRAFPSLLR